jgi:mxaJ protein
VVGYPVYGDDSRDAPLSAIIDAVARGDLDVAVVSGPAAGWLARRQPGHLRVVPIADADRTTRAQMSFDIAMGVRRDDAELRARLDAVIARRRTEIDRLLARFRVTRI